MNNKCFRSHVHRDYVTSQWNILHKWPTKQTKKKTPPDMKSTQLTYKTNPRFPASIMLFFIFQIELAGRTSGRVTSHGDIPLFMYWFYTPSSPGPAEHCVVVADNLFFSFSQNPQPCFLAIKYSRYMNEWGLPTSIVAKMPALCSGIDGRLIMWLASKLS